MKCEESDLRKRRQFLGEMSCGAVGSASMLSSILSMRMTGSLAAASEDGDGDYKALVCLFLAGGNDSFNMLAPVDDAGHAQYKSARIGLALPKTDFLPFTNPLPAPDGRTLGVHKKMPELHTLFEQGKAAFVANVGTLVEPTTLAAISAKTARLPLGLFSHSDQQLHWQSGLPRNRSPLNGWGGRMSDLINDLNGVSGVSMNVSISGINMFQSGEGSVPLARSASAVAQISNWNDANFALRRNAMETLLDAEYRNAFQRSFAIKKKEAIEVNQEYQSALDQSNPLLTEFTPGNPLSGQLKAVAETIGARDALCKRRQTFFVQLGGWDHHGSLEDHPELLKMVSQAVGEFQEAMVELGVEDEVTLFSASDFGRTLASNGGGSDHAWGGNHFVIGGAVEGGQIYGSYPELAIGSILDTGRGRFVPTTSVDQYVADLALWMGVSPGNLGLVLPNLSEFHDVVANGPPMGFMKVSE
jgi:uncharacterized protein (DUF1501 family)